MHNHIQCGKPAFLKYNFDVFATHPVSYGGDKIRMIYGFLGNNKRKDMDRKSFKY